MFRTTLRSLWSHKRRLISTCVAVLLGVAFMTGTLVLSATVNTVFDDLFGDLSEGTDAVVRGEELFNSSFAGSQRDLLDESVVADIAAVDGVAQAEGSITTFQLTLLDSDGDPMGGGLGPPTLTGTWLEDRDLASFEVAEGRAPEGPGEVIVNRAAVEDGDLTIGSDVTLITPAGNQTLTLVGSSRFGEADSAGGAINVDALLEQTQELAGEPGKVDTISVHAADGVTPDELVANIEAADISTPIDVVTGQEAADEQASDVKSGFAFFTTMLLVFAAIALFVGWFIISNTFSILVAQRTRELALLRAIGASRRQVLGSVLLEALLIGLFSSVVGFLAGIGLALAAFAGLDAIGFGLPQTSLVITPVIAAQAMVAGLVITGVAAIGPAIKATRVPPMAALRDVAIDRTAGSLRRGIIGLIILGLGILAISPAFGSDPTSDQIPGIGMGLFLIVISVLVSGPVLARPLARVVGAPVPWIRGVTGTLARENAMRSPRRTASTTAALTIGVALVAFITIFASSVQTSINSSIGEGFEGDYLILPVNQFTFAGVSPELADEVAQIDGVETVTGLGIVLAEIGLPDGGTPADVLVGIDPVTFTEVFDAKMAEGSVSDLTDEGMIVDQTTAKEKSLAVGDTVTVVATGGREGEYTIQALSDDPALLDSWTITREAVNSLSPQPTDYQIGVKADPNIDPESIRQPIEDVLVTYPTMKVQNAEEFTDGIVSSISTLLNVIYALLAVSIIIALIGIANTLSLSIHERTRELGLLRAMGMTRPQLRSSVRWEATIVALIGTTVGLLLGLILSWVMVRALSSQGISSFSVPVSGMVTVVVFGAALGVLASVRPAYKAAKLNVLDAIATE